MKRIGAIEILETLSEKVSPKHTALILVDTTNDFCSPEGKTKTVANRPIEHALSIIPNLQVLLQSAREAGLMICHIWHTTLPNNMSDSGPWLDARSRATYSIPDLCVDGSWGQQTVAELSPLPNEQIIKKCRYSAFVGTRLDQILRSNGIRTTVIAGVSTNVCVEATARDAFSCEYYVVMPEDCVAAWDFELHRATLETLRKRYGVTCASKQLVDLWTGLSSYSKGFVKLEDK
jgi:ureidoacrylate peracid hydrolase